MLTLITGVPGTGKTCYAMTYIKAAIAEGRPIFAHGIMEFVLPHEPIYCSATTCKYCEANKPAKGALLAEDWQLWAPDGAYIVMDEVQHIYRPRAGARELPPSVAAFETHRHQGIDFLLMTQNPMLMDKNIRLLVSKHIHLKGTWAHRVQLEWGETSEDVKRTTDAIRSVYTLDKKNFGLYKSAEIHSKIKRKLPYQVYLAGFALVLCGYFAYTIMGRVGGLSNAEAATLEEIDSSSIPLQAVTPRQRTAGNVYDREPVERLFVESAPAFAHLVEVVAYPRLAGCIRGNLKCKCYTQQATLLDIPLNQCLAFVANPPFNPYLLVDDNSRNDSEFGSRMETTSSAQPSRREPVLKNLDDQLLLPYNSANAYGYTKPYK